MNKRAIWIGVAFFLVIILGYVLFTLAPRFAVDKEKQTTLQIALGNRIDTVLYNFTPNGVLQSAPFAGEGTVVSRARRGDIGLALSAVTPDDGIGTMLVLETAEGSRVLADPDAIRDVPAISFDGLLVAYAELALPFGETFYSENISNWHVYVMDVASGETQDLGVGYAPYFISENPHVVIYSTPDGIASYVINGSESAWMSDGHPASVTTKAVQASLDGTQLGVFNNLTKGYSVYTITQAFPLELSALGEPPAAFEQAAFLSGYLYGTVYNRETGMYELWRYSHEEIEAPFSKGGEVIYTFAADQIPYQLIP